MCAGHDFTRLALRLQTQGQNNKEHKRPNDSE